MFEKILERFGSKEPLEVEDLTSADELLRERKKEELEKIDSKAKDLQGEVRDSIENLDEAVDELEGFVDEKDRAVIEDVVSNIVEERKKLIQDFSIGKEPEELKDDLEEFIQEFRSMTKKEAAVLEEVYLDNQFKKPLGNVESVKERLEQFLDSEYVLEKRIEKLGEKTDRLEELRQELAEMKSEVHEMDPEALKTEIEDVKQELEELEESEKMDEYRGKEEKLGEIRKERKSLERKIGAAIGKMERGLKKLLYEGEIGKVSREGSEVLREIRDRDKQEIIDRRPEEVEEAVKAVKKSIDGEILEEKTEEKLVEGADVLENFSDLKEELEEKKEKIAIYREQLGNHEAMERKQELEEKRKYLQEELEETKEKKEELRERINDKREKVEETEQEIISVLENQLSREVLREK